MTESDDIATHIMVGAQTALYRMGVHNGDPAFQAALLYGVGWSVTTQQTCVQCSTLFVGRKGLGLCSAACQSERIHQMEHDWS